MTTVYSYGEYADVTVNNETGDMTCTCPEVPEHGPMNVSQGENLPCIVTRFTAAQWPPS